MPQARKYPTKSILDEPYDEEKVPKLREKMTRKHNVTIKSREFVQKMAAFGHSTELIGKRMGLTGRSVRRLYGPELKFGKQLMTEEVASVLLQSIRDGDTDAAKFYLKNRAGWSDRIDAELASFMSFLSDEPVTDTKDWQDRFAKMRGEPVEGEASEVWVDDEDNMIPAPGTETVQ